MIETAALSRAIMTYYDSLLYTQADYDTLFASVELIYILSMEIGSAPVFLISNRPVSLAYINDVGVPSRSEEHTSAERHQQEAGRS